MKYRIHFMFKGEQYYTETDGGWGIADIRGGIWVTEKLTTKENNDDKFKYWIPPSQLLYVEHVEGAVPVQEPIPPPEPDPLEECKDPKYRTRREIRAIIREVAKQHEKFKAVRLIKFDKDLKTGVLSLNDIVEWGPLEDINKSYPYGRNIDRSVGEYTNHLMSIEPIEHDDGWEHNR